MSGTEDKTILSKLLRDVSDAQSSVESCLRSLNTPTEVTERNTKRLIVALQDLDRYHAARNNAELAVASAEMKLKSLESNSPVQH